MDPKLEIPLKHALAHRALSQTSHAPVSHVKTLSISIGAAAVLGIVAGVVPKKQHTLKHLALGGSAVALALAALLFTFGD